MALPSAFPFQAGLQETDGAALAGHVELLTLHSGSNADGETASQTGPEIPAIWASLSPVKLAYKVYHHRG